MFHDLALVYDPERRRCDVRFGADGEPEIDVTSITPVLISIGTDARAADDDELPEGRTFLNDGLPGDRRGAPGDACDPSGVLSGCRMWLLDRAKHTETTRRFVELWLAEGLAWAGDTGAPAEIEVRWLAPERLGYRVHVAGRGIERRLLPPVGAA